MRSMIKYIALLVFSGVMLPFYRPYTPVIPDSRKPISVVSAIDGPVKQDGDFHFSFMHDVAAKLLPVIKFF